LLDEGVEFMQIILKTETDHQHGNQEQNNRRGEKRSLYDRIENIR